MNNRQKEVLQSQLNNEKKTLNDLKQIYKKALDDINNNIAALQGRTDTENLQSIIYQTDYQKALKKQVEGILDELNTKQFNSISEYLTNCYEDGFIGTMYDLQGQGVPLIFPIDQGQVVRALQTESKLSQSLYDSLGENTALLKKRISSNISRGIAQGSSYYDISKGIAAGMTGDYSKMRGGALGKAMTIARTEGHRISTASAHDAAVKSKEAGADVVKQWDAALDRRTRPHHSQLDGQIRELDEPFEVAGRKAMYPGGFGVASEDINCRCVSLTRARWALEDEDGTFTKWDSETGALLTIEEKNYEAFKTKYKEVVDVLKNDSPKQVKKVVKNYGKTDTSDHGPQDSLSKYTKPDGSLTPEREALHRQIIDEFFEDAKKPKGQPTFTVMGGGPASGKSTMINSGAVSLPDDSIMIDSDAIKGKLPEYRLTSQISYVKAVNGETAAGYVHEESSALAKRIMNIANNDGYNYVLDGTGDGSVKSLTKKIQDARKSGAKVVGVYATVPTDVALKRATERGIKTGRVIRPEVITNTHKKVSQILPECAHLFDEVKLYDTTNEAILIATGGNGKGLAAAPGQEKLFEEFLKKAK